MTELLAPGGSYDNCIAAINAGADAIYVGASKFGARAFADNLTCEQLKDVIDYAHLFNRRVYLTVNTLLKDSEIEDDLYDVICPLYECGLDAVLVQDLGVLKYLHEQFPDMELHASTQMTSFGGDYPVLKKYGVTRIVLPREASIDEIKYLKNKYNVEIETFVHGALCYSYSGQCLMSSHIGSRSGNRGSCAQPCRMEYDVYKGKSRLNSENEKYLLSPKDICTLDIIPDIINAGVFSLKIEGRMKKLPYVAGVVSIYRKYIDMYESGIGYKVDPGDVETLYNLFNRKGFSEGYYYRHNGREMITLSKPDFRKEDKNLTSSLTEQYSGRKLKKTVNLNVFAHAGYNLMITSDDGMVSVSSDMVDKAKNRPLCADDIEKRIRKMGDTDFVAGEVNIDAGDDIFIPVGSVNALRREFAVAYKEYLLSDFRRSAIPKDFSFKHESLAEYNGKVDLHVLVSDYKQLKPVIEENCVRRVYFEAEGFLPDKLCSFIDEVKNSGKEAFLAFPYILRDKDSFFGRYINSIKQADGYLLRNLAQYCYITDDKLEKNIVFDYNVYSFNTLAKDVLNEQGNAQTTLPLELTFNELKKRSAKGEEMIIYGYMPAMFTAGCLNKTCNSCNHNNDELILKDRLGNGFPVKCRCDECYNIIFNCKRLCLLKYLDRIGEINVSALRLSFTKEEENEVKHVLKQFILAKKGHAEVDISDFTYGHFINGVD